MKDEEYNEKMYKLEVYKALYKAYADEIRNLWQRSIFLGAFMTLAWGGYGALQLKMIEKCLSNICAYHFASLGLCAVIMILSLLWIAMAKGSKFVQEAHERHIKDLGFDKVKKIVIENCDKRLFCDLGKYNNPPSKDNKSEIMDTNPNLFFGGDLKPYRYSPSKINIALGQFSYLLALALCIRHIKCYFCGQTNIIDIDSLLFGVFIVAIIVCHIFCIKYLKSALKGKNK